MSFSAALDGFPDALSSVTPEYAKALKPALLQAASARGEYPSSLALVEKLRLEISQESSSPEKVARLVAASPLMSLRVIAVANSALYARANLVETVEAAVQHLGLRRLQSIVEELGDKKSYHATFIGRSIAGGALQQTLVANILSRSLAECFMPRGMLGDRAYITSCLLRSPAVMLSYLRPSIYSACCLEFDKTRTLFERNFKKAMGESAADFAVSLSESLSFPMTTGRMLSYLEVPPWNRRGGAGEDLKDARLLANAVFMGHRLADEICKFTGFIPLDSLIADLSDKSNLEGKQIKVAVGELPQRFMQMCQNLGVKPSRLPAYLSNYETKMVGNDGKTIADKFKFPGIAERINPFLYELKACLNTRAQAEEFGHLPQAVYCTLQALVKGLNFDRAIFYRHSVLDSMLHPVVTYGASPPELGLEVRRTNSAKNEFMPDVQAALQKKTVFQGDPIFNDDWPLTAFPVICEGQVEGVFFADKLGKKNALPLDTQEQVAVVALAEGWHEVSSQFR